MACQHQKLNGRCLECLEARIFELEVQVKDAKNIQSDWERAHDLLDKAGVLTTPPGHCGNHLIKRIEAVLAVWTPIGELSGQTCQDLKFVCNTSKETIAAIKAHRASFIA